MYLYSRHSFARRILVGLLLSCLGDALLVWPNYFLHGMMAFGAAQVRMEAHSYSSLMSGCLGRFLWSANTNKISKFLLLEYNTQPIIFNYCW